MFTQLIKDLPKLYRFKKRLPITPILAYIEFYKDNAWIHPKTLRRVLLTLKYNRIRRFIGVYPKEKKGEVGYLFKLCSHIGIEEIKEEYKTTSIQPDKCYSTLFFPMFSIEGKVVFCDGNVVLDTIKPENFINTLNESFWKLEGICERKKCPLALYNLYLRALINKPPKYY